MGFEPDPFTPYWDGEDEEEQSFANNDGSPLFFDGDWTPPAPNQRYTVGQRCPQCGNMMELKTNTRTNHKFVGCTNYPTCSVAGKSR